MVYVKIPSKASKDISYLYMSDCLSTSSGKLFLQSAFRCLHGMKTALTIETPIISERICKPCTGSKETHWWEEGGS